MAEGHTPIEEMELFRRYASVADWAWREVTTWSPLARDTMGLQLIRACDSIGANLVEGDGRGTDRDAAHFFVIARASAREARYWIQRAVERGVVSSDSGQAQIGTPVSATQLLNRLIRYRRTPAADRVREPLERYAPTEEGDPFDDIFPGE